MNIKISEWIKNKSGNKYKKDKNIIDFLAIKNQIEELLNNNHSIKIIYEYLFDTKKISCSYITFYRLVKQHITEKNTSLLENKFSNNYKQDEISKNDKEMLIEEIV